MRAIPAIVGPTASGKSELGIRLALAGRGEIVNLDSVQVYRGLYVATAKVPPAQRRGVPHHLIDIADPVENVTAGQYARLARTVIEEIEARGRTAILVGGSGFYLRALVNPLFESPATDLALRERLNTIRVRHGPGHLHRMLSRIDPNAAARVSPADWSRTMRAIEFSLQTGERFSEQQRKLPDRPELASRIRVIALDPPRDLLYSRINRRAERMFEEGLVSEVESLVQSGVSLSAKAFQAHGYRRVVEHLSGLRSREEALEQMKLDTRHYAKRQLSWWRKWPEVRWVPHFGEEPDAFAEASQHLGW